METKLKAYCGCKQSLQSTDVITPTEVIRWATAHAAEFNHSLIFQGEIRVVKPRKVLQRRNDYQHQP